MLIHEDRLFPSDPATRAIARALYGHIRKLPIVSPHGHTQAAWFARNEPFPDPATLLVQPDHYVYRMLYSQGVSLDDLEIGQAELKNPRKVWRIFASHYYLFRGTPTRMWLDYAFQELFGLEDLLSEKTADLYYDTIADKLRAPEFRPRALYERFNIEVLATTDSPLDSLDDHQAIRDSGWKARIIPNFRPDPVVDPEFAGFAESHCQARRADRRRHVLLEGLSRGAAQGTGPLPVDWVAPRPIMAIRPRRPPIFPRLRRRGLFGRVLSGQADAQQKELFRAQMLTEMARMSLDDGLVMQIHPGSRAQPQSRSL